MATLVEKIGWTEWITHTNFSFKIGASHPHEIVRRAVECGYSGLCVADFDGVYGLARSFRALKKIKEKIPEVSTRLFYGAEIHFAKDHDLPVIQQDTLVLVATSHKGYFNLCRLLSYSHRDGKTEANIPLEYLCHADLQDLVAIQPMRGLIHRANGEFNLRKKADLLLQAFGRENFFLAISRHLNEAEDAAIQPFLQLKAALNLKCILSQDAFFHTPEVKGLSDLIQAIRVNLPIDRAVGYTFANEERCLHPLRGLDARFRSLPIYQEALLEAKSLGDRMNFSLNELRYHYPKEMLPEGYSAQGFLEKLVWEAARKRYGSELPEKLKELLGKELSLIQHLGFADYFLTVWDIVRWAREQQILCQGRGSAANSAVCYVLGITSVDPALFDVLFERFISVERGDPPDIDVDFEHERREEVIQYIYERYGRPKAAMVANVITYQSRGALRAAGKALGIAEEAQSKASDLLESREFRYGGTEHTVEEVKQELSSSDVEPSANPIPFELWAKMAGKIEGFPSHLGIHSGGFILSDRSLDWLVPQEPATMEGRTVIQWCKEDIEALGFFKIDVLALGMLTAVKKCFESIETHYGQKLTLANIPHGDKGTYDMICRAETVGTFQIESRAQMSMLPRLKPRCFYDLVVEVAIIRPGPIQGGMIHPYLKRRDGTEKTTFPDARLEPILARTLGIPIFQEQVMRIAMAVGGFTPGEADELRRNIGSFSMKGRVELWVGKLADGMKANGIPEAFIQTILSQLKGFSSYGFPESHAASFALIAYISSYLKHHYPALFYLSLLNSQPMGFYSPHVLLRTAYLEGIEIRPVCVVHSEWDHTVERVKGNGANPTFAIRIGMRLVRSLREQSSRELLERRNQVGGWVNFEDFVKNSKISRVDFTALAEADAFRLYGMDRRQAIWKSEAAPFAQYLEDSEKLFSFLPETSVERMESDFHATSTSLGPHPTEIIKRENWQFEVPLRSLILARDIQRVAPGKRVSVFGMIIVRQAPPAAKGMVFATIEDESGLINLAFGPQTYAKYRRLIDRQAFLCLGGRLQKQGDAHSIMVEVVYAPKIRQAEVIEINQEGADNTQDILGLELVESRNYC